MSPQLWSPSWKDPNILVELTPTLSALLLEKAVGYTYWGPQTGTRIEDSTSGDISSRKGGAGWSSVPSQWLCLQLARALESPPTTVRS